MHARCHDLRLALAYSLQVKPQGNQVNYIEFLVSCTISEYTTLAIAIASARAKWQKLILLLLLRARSLNLRMRAPS